MTTNRIRDFRLEKQWTQEKLAQKARVTFSTISLLERGHRNPSPLVAYRIAKALGRDLQEVFPDVPEEAAV
jgi:putative transcriptional regulator